MILFDIFGGSPQLASYYSGLQLHLKNKDSMEGVLCPDNIKWSVLAKDYKS